MRIAGRGTLIALAAAVSVSGQTLLSPPAQALELRQIGQFKQPVYVTAPVAAKGRLYVA